MSATSQQPKSTEQLRADVEAARVRLVGTVGELGRTIDETKQDLKRRAKKIAPIVGGVVAAAIALRLVIKHR
jgi:hypothetical protein